MSIRMDRDNSIYYTNKELLNIEVNQLTKLHDSITPRNIIKQSIINSINKNGVKLINKEWVIVDLDISKFNYLIIKDVL